MKKKTLLMQTAKVCVFVYSILDWWWFFCFSCLSYYIYIYNAYFFFDMQTELNERKRFRLTCMYRHEDLPISHIIIHVACTCMATLCCV